MLTEYDIRESARERRAAIERYAFENPARRNVRLKAERSRRQAGELEAYLATRRRELAAIAVLDAAEQTRPYDWEQDRQTEFALNGPSEQRRSDYVSHGAGI